MGRRQVEETPSYQGFTLQKASFTIATLSLLPQNTYFFFILDDFPGYSQILLNYPKYMILP